MTTTRLSDRVLRRVTMLADDPGSQPRSKSTVVGISRAYLARLAGISESTIGARSSEWRKAMAAGEVPPSDAVNVDDWADFCRWLLERRRLTKLVPESSLDGLTSGERHKLLSDARARAARDVQVFMRRARELFE